MMNLRAFAPFEKNWFSLLLLVGAFLVPLAFTLRLLISYDNPMDFRYFWGVGQVWELGLNPYAPEFSESMIAVFQAEEMDRFLRNPFHNWVYSPHIWAPTRFLAFFDFFTAFWIWTFLNMAMIYAGTCLIAASFLEFDRRWHWAVTALLLVYTVLSIGGPTSLTVGQPSGAIYFAAAAFVFGALRDRMWFVVLGLVLLTMKASVGVPFVVLALVLPRLWLAVGVAGVISVFLALPSLLIEGLMPVISGYLRGVQAYAAFEPNAPYSMTGVRAIVYQFTGRDLSGLVTVLLAAALAGGIVWIGVRSARPLSVTFVAALAMIFFVIPLHLYDLMLISLLVIGATRVWYGLIYGFVLVCLFRVNYLSELLGLQEKSFSFAGSLLATFLLALLLVASLVLFWRTPPKVPVPAP